MEQKGEFLKRGAKSIQQKIDFACGSGERAVTITGDFEIEETIYIPSDFVLTLENCHLKMADNTFCNMFTNISCRTPKGRTKEGTDRNITVKGIGRAILDGGNYNLLSERNSLKDGNPHISVNSILLFTNVKGFCVQGLHIRNQRWWALNFIHCSNGRISEIDFLADYSYIDENGARIYGLSLQHYSKYYIKNADGIDLRTGCHDIIIENITGFTQDDTIALTGLLGVMETELFYLENADNDIYNVSIRNVQASSACSIVRLLNQSGVKLYNILVDGVFDTSKNSPYVDKGGTTVRLGDNHLYGTRHATIDEAYNITVKNVYSRAQAAMRVAGAMRNCRFENIQLFDTGEKLIENNATVDITPFIKN